MKSYIIAVLAGLTCLPVTIGVDRAGPFPFVVVLYLAIGALGGFLAMLAFGRGEKGSAGRMTALFVAGVMVSEVIFFATYVLGVGNWDPSTSLSFALSVVLVDFGLTAPFAGGAFFAVALVFGSAG